MNNFILTIDSNTFIWTQHDEGLVYNSTNFKSANFEVHGIIKEICKQLDKPENLYSVSLSQAEIEIPYVKKWVEDLLLIESATLKPFGKDISASLKPIFKIQNDVKKIADSNSYSDIIGCLKEVTFHLTGAEIALGEMEYHKQFLYPIKSKECLKYNELTAFLNFIPQKENVALNFIGDCDFYPEINALCKLLDKRKNLVTFYFRLEDICRIWNNIHILIADCNICLLCKANETTKEYINFARKNIPYAHLQFLIGSTEENVIIEGIDLK